MDLETAEFVAESGDVGEDKHEVASDNQKEHLADLDRREQEFGGEYQEKHLADLESDGQVGGELEEQHLADWQSERQAAATAALDDYVCAQQAVDKGLAEIRASFPLESNGVVHWYGSRNSFVVFLGGRKEEFRVKALAKKRSRETEWEAYLEAVQQAKSFVIGGGACTSNALRMQ